MQAARLGGDHAEGEGGRQPADPVKIATFNAAGIENYEHFMNLLAVPFDTREQTDSLSPFIPQVPGFRASFRAGSPL